MICMVGWETPDAVLHAAAEETLQEIFDYPDYDIWTTTSDSEIQCRIISEVSDQMSTTDSPSSAHFMLTITHFMLCQICLAHMIASYYRENWMSQHPFRPDYIMIHKVCRSYTA
jgi:hypothetical protein